MGRGHIFAEQKTVYRVLERAAITLSRTVAEVTVLPFSSRFAIFICISACEAICGEWVTHMTWAVFAQSQSFLPIWHRQFGRTASFRGAPRKQKYCGRSIAGSVLFAYVGMLGPEWAPHIITASIMGAPAGLVLSKILCPEEGEPETSGVVELKTECKEKSIIEAASKGAIDGMHLAFIVGTVLIAFIAIIATVNGVLGYFGHACDVVAGWFGQTFLYADKISIQSILGIILWPVAWLIGAPSSDAQIVASLIGEKLVLNEFVAYSDLLNHMTVGDKAAVLQELTQKGKLIATFALCGFANFSSIGINVGCIACIFAA